MHKNCAYYAGNMLNALATYYAPNYDDKIGAGLLGTWSQLGKQPTQLQHQWVPGVYWGSKCSTVLVSFSSVGVVVELWVCDLSLRDLDSPSVGY